MSGSAGATGDKSGLRVVIAALAVNVAIAIFKFIAAGFSRSSAMLAEACHSTADTANQIFLLVGMRKSARPPDRDHPFGYGPETYFWAFMVALCIFSVGGFFSVHEGVEKILHRNDASGELGDPRWAYVVLGVSMLLETYSLSVAMKEFRHIRAGRGVRRTLKETRDPTVLTVLFEDLAALFGLVVAFAGILLSRVTGNVAYDGAASIVVGLALGAVAFVLARDTKSLLIGQSANEDDEKKIREIVTAHRDVVELVHLRTMHMAPEEVLAAIKVRFLGNLDARTLELRINDIEAELRRALPRLRRIYIEPGFNEESARASLNQPPAARSWAVATRERQRRFEIVPMKAADLDDIMDIERVSFRAPWSRQVFVEELDRDWAHVDVLKERRTGATVLAFVNYWLVRDEVHVLNVASHPETRRQGHGSRLLEHVIAFANRNKCRYVTLEVRRSNSGAIRLYRKYGFRPVGVRPNYYVEDNEDAIVMLLELVAPA